MFDDFKELLSIFNAQKVKYLIVGGYAVSFHAQPRATKDIDLLIKPDAENARAVYDALGKFGAPLDGLTAEDFIARDKLGRRSPRPCPSRTRPIPETSSARRLSSLQDCR
jgi:hypothetical protein